MSTYTRPLTLDLGSLHTGLVGTLSYKVVSAGGDITYIAQTTAGISESAPGSYRASAQFSTAWGWVVIQWLAGDISAQEVINTSDNLPGFSGGGSGNGGVPPDQCSFDPALGAAKDRIRNRIGDWNGQPRWFLADATINAMLSTLGSEDETAAQALESISAQCIQLANMTDQVDMKRQYTDRSKRCMELALQIRSVSVASKSASAAYAGLLPVPDGVDDL